MLDEQRPTKKMRMSQQLSDTPEAQTTDTKRSARMMQAMRQIMLYSYVFMNTNFLLLVMNLQYVYNSYITFFSLIKVTFWSFSCVNSSENTDVSLVDNQNNERADSSR